MEVTKTLEPGDRGTARLLRRYGERLVCVRYRFDPTRKKNVTTVELVVDERDAPEGYHPMYQRRPEPKQQVLVRVEFDGTETRAGEGRLWAVGSRAARVGFTLCDGQRHGSGG